MKAERLDGQPTRLQRHVPGLLTVRTYQAGWLRSDLVAGVVLAAILVPQGMAYAELAGLPAVNGLYTTDRLPRRLRPHGSVEDPRARSRLVTRPVDLRRHHPARRGG